MSSKRRQAKWWQVYVMLVLFMGLFWLELQIPLTYTENVIAQLGILVLIFGSGQLWLRANQSALMDLDQADGHWEMKVYEFPPFQRAQTDGDGDLDEGTTIQIPAAAVKGVLSDTFEWQSPERGASVFADQDDASRNG